MTYMRGRKVKVIYRGRPGNTEAQNSQPQEIGIDGEDLRFSRGVTWEVFPNNVEVLVDADNFMVEHNSFSAPTNSD